MGRTGLGLSSANFTASSTSSRTLSSSSRVCGQRSSNASYSGSMQ